jgi:hypothetical protein
MINSMPFFVVAVNHLSMGSLVGELVKIFSQKCGNFTHNLQNPSICSGGLPLPCDMVLISIGFPLWRMREE